MSITERAIAARDDRNALREAEREGLRVGRIVAHRRCLANILCVDLDNHEPVASTSDGSSTEWIVEGLCFTAHTDTCDGSRPWRVNYHGPARFDGPHVIRGNSLSTNSLRDFDTLAALGDLIAHDEERQNAGRHG